MANIVIPTVDLSPFLSSENDMEGKEKARNLINKACSDYGFFYIVNHGLPQELLNQAMHLSKTFFGYPDEEKLKSSPKSGSPFPVGYGKQPETIAEKNEYFLMFPPHSIFNVFPENPPDFKETLEEFFGEFAKIAELIVALINECLGLPQNLLKEYNDERSWDLLSMIHYFGATDTQKCGLSEHEDGNLVSLVVQDDAGGLEVFVDGDWIPLVPAEGKIVVNVGDVIQVLTNGKFKSATHRVVSPIGRSRNSSVYFYNVNGDKWIEPLPQYTEKILEPAKYRGFVYKDYLNMRMRNKTHPPSRPQDVITIAHFAI